MATAETKSPNPADAAKATVVSPVPKKKKATRAYLLLLGLAGAAVAVYFIHGYVTRNEVDTDDAEVDADVVPISTRVGGLILHMDIKDNQHVTAGQVIAQIDDADYAAKVEAAQADVDAATAQADQADAQVDITKSTSGGALSSAKARLGGADASVRTAGAQIDAASAAVAQAKANLGKVQNDYDRDRKLHDAGAVSGAQVDNDKAARDAAAAAVDAANANLAAARDAQSRAQSQVAEAQGSVQQSTPVERQIASAVALAKLAHAHVASTQAALQIAKLQLSYTKIVAPVSGTVSKLGAHEGQLVQTGTMLVMIVPSTTYVIANFKETQLERIRSGDPVDISIDAFGGSKLHGTVDSVSAGTGARFSMMPPDNATGNFVKVVQRVPVKIAWDAGQDLSQMHAGLSVEVKVHLQH